MEIIKLDPKYKKRAAEIVAAAFFEYPMFTFYFPDPKKRARVLPWYLGNVLNCALRYGEVCTTPEISGVIFTLPPVTLISHRVNMFKIVFYLHHSLLGYRDYQRSQECEKFVADTHEMIMGDRPHYYLWGLTVDPSQKRKGIGTALLKPVIEKADARKNSDLPGNTRRKKRCVLSKAGFYPGSYR